MIRAILFDAGNTLIRVDWAAVAAALEDGGVAVAPETLRRAEWTARVRLDTDLFAAPGAFSTESRDTTARYTQYVLEAAGVHDPAVHARITEWRRAYNPPIGLWTVAEPEAMAALVLAREAGCVTGVVSNSNGTVREILARLGLTRHLDFVLDSHEERVEKPDPRIFARALARAGVGADAAAYIGDLYSVDVLGARRAGVRAVLMDPGGCWGERDCPRAPTVLDAVRTLLGPGRAGSRDEA
jgi:HAD superfamily hydrolase (TIGR01549 family)